MSKHTLADIEDSATTDAQITSHVGYNAYNEPYTFYRCTGCGDEAYYRTDLAQGGCSCAP
jgi:subtilase family serine protease